jgi:hypothetical protein
MRALFVIAFFKFWVVGWSAALCALFFQLYIKTDLRVFKKLADAQCGGVCRHVSWNGGACGGVLKHAAWKD